MFFIRQPRVFEFCDSASITGSPRLFSSFLTIMSNKGAEMSDMTEIICLAVVNLTSFSALSFSRVVFCLCLAHPWMGRGLAALPAGALYAWDTPQLGGSYPTCHHLAQCHHLLLSLFSTAHSAPLWHPECLPACCVRVGGPTAGERLQPPQLLQECVISTAHVCLDRSRPALAHSQVTWHATVT